MVYLIVQLNTLLAQIRTRYWHILHTLLFEPQKDGIVMLWIISKLHHFSLFRHPHVANLPKAKDLLTILLYIQHATPYHSAMTLPVLHSSSFMIASFNKVSFYAFACSQWQHYHSD